MMPFAIAIGRAMLSAATPVAIQAAANSLTGMRKNKQTAIITDAFNAAAAANEFLIQVQDLADPNASFALREAMARHQASLAAEKEKIDALLAETLSAQDAARQQ